MRRNPAQPAAGTVLCRLEDLTDPGAKGFMFTTPFANFFGFLVRKGDQAYGYIDSCPHAGWRLSPFDDDGFLTPEKDYILCSGHIAMFRLEDGVCEGGPCFGDELTSWPVRVEDGAVIAA